MPKVRRVGSVSRDRSRSAPYPTLSDPSSPKSLSGLAADDDAREWEEARCPICMEHPHNAVLLKCSSHEKGCRPYMCNTSYRHSNCLDQFCKSSSVPYSTTLILREIPLATSSNVSGRGREEEDESALTGHASSPCGSHVGTKLACPLCRGDLFGYAVVEPARSFMNEKARNCSTEACGFAGAYSELRKHARSEHPFVRPSEVDPTRQHDWMRLERERDLDDVLSLVQPGLAEDGSGSGSGAAEDRSDDFNSWVSSFFASVFRSIEMMLVSRLLSSSEDRDSPRSRWPERTPRSRREGGGGSSSSTRLGGNFRESNSRTNQLRWRANYDAPATPRRNYSSSQARGPAPAPRSRRPRWRNQRWSGYNNQQQQR